MKAKIIVSALILSAAAIGTAQAQLAPFDGVYGKQYSNATREQVQQELQAARAAGQTGNEDMDNQPFTAQVDTQTNQAAAPATTDSHTSSLSDMKFGDSDNQPFQG
jgi:hypothetical protein